MDSPPREIDEPALHVRADELDVHPIADVETLEPADHPAFHHRLDDAHPRPLLRRAGDDRVEALAEARGEEERGGGLPHLALHLGGVVLLLGAVAGERGKLVVRVRRRPARDRGLQQALRREIGVAPIRRRRVGVVPHGEAEVPVGMLAG